MAWNEPGGGKDKDPWGNRGDQNGPPDLDEAFKKLQEKFGGIFGGRRGGGGSGAGAGKGMGLVVLVVIGLIWGASGFYTVEQGKQGVVLRFGDYVDTTQSGLRWIPRFIETVEIVDVQTVQIRELGYRGDISRGGSAQVMDRESLMLTQDENIVSVQLAVQYRIKDAKDFLFNVSNPDDTLSQVTESALREIVGKSKMDFVLTEGRGEIAGRTEEMVQEILDSYKVGLAIVDITVQDAQPPEQVQHAFADAVKAREDEERLKNKAEAYAKKVLPEARGQAARQLEEANGYRAQVIARAEGEASRFNQILKEYKRAPQITRDRLYLEAVEVVMSSVSKVMVDVDGGNNMFYLPLDRIVNQGPALPLSGGATASSTEAMTEAALEQMRQEAKKQVERAMRDRLRGGREGR